MPARSPRSSYSTHTCIPCTAQTRSAAPDAPGSTETPPPIIPPTRGATSAVSTIPADSPYATPTLPGFLSAAIPAAQTIHTENLPGSTLLPPRTAPAGCIGPAARPPPGPPQIPRPHPPTQEKKKNSKRPPKKPKHPVPPAASAMSPPQNRKKRSEKPGKKTQNPKKPTAPEKKKKKNPPLNPSPAGSSGPAPPF